MFDSSTATLVISLVISFVFLRWFMSSDQFTEGSGLGGENRRRRRSYTPAMISQVQSIAPTLTREQIIYDLERTGDANETLNRFFTEGNLPLPPNSIHNTSATGTTSSVSRGSSGTTSSKLESKISSDSKIKTVSHEDDDAMGFDFASKKREMILKARRRLSEKEGIQF
ncbi:unnamed protein product [[Candida] boidinii]|uniref:Unnamed protein product n=1 Tax=Candida boidinii TaxID=5477 RepID=A0A9W6T241_CANBO|nr:hypothetical protein B5S30_g2434 [[Candida] boidinii]OWB85047.1 hypothetical protein B5S33_g3704 [[Candida] boidinii]GME72289.1 unnamed protein product [[Candida] boidinii]GMF98591.1 unnamed protein product [[Candida] boidinii]